MQEPTALPSADVQPGVNDVEKGAMGDDASKTTVQALNKRLVHLLV